MLEIMKASAGSGKTWSLAKKYISLLLTSKDHYAYRHILAVTFTNKATDEMKGRILKELHLLAAEPEKSGYLSSFVPSVFHSSDEVKQRAGEVLSNILHDYSAFAVSTIDKFFQQTLKAFSREIGQFASYQVELDKDSLVAESVDRILDSLTEDDDNLLAWLTANVLEQIEQGGRYSMDANLLDMAKRLMSPQRQSVMDEYSVNQATAYSKEHLTVIRERCREIEKAFRDAVRTKAGNVLSLLHESGVDASDFNRGFMNVLYAYEELSSTDTVMAPSASFLDKASDCSKWFAKAKAKEMLPLVYPLLEAPLEEFCALFGKEYAVYNTAKVLDGQLYGLGVAGELDKTFKALMKEKNVLCIDDSNTILRDLIDGSDAPFIYEKLGVRYENFLLDEFQDTAEVQWQNLMPLLLNSDSQGGDNLIVGDVKQSIYRWRGSDWKLLDKVVPEKFPDHKETILDTNWRSLPDIVRFNNGFFTYAASLIDCIDGHENGGPMAAIYRDVSQKTPQKHVSGGHVSLTFCPKDQQLHQVLESVRNVMDKGGLLSEIAVLVRSNAIGEAVSQYLIENGISVITDDSLKIKNSVTVRRMVSLMSYMDNPEDTVSGYLADSLDVQLHAGALSLVDMAEDLFRSIKKNDSESIWRGEILHIQSFMDCLYDYTSANGNALRGFLKWWDGQDPSISSPASGDSVRVMTIHKSKGLDFPYVIIPFVEKVSLFKPVNNWCVPTLSHTPLEGVAEGVYDVCLSSSSENTLFDEDYHKELFLQHVDNMNTLYVAMTRAALGMHIVAASPSASFHKAMEKNDLSGFRDLSQILYSYVTTPGNDLPVVYSFEDDVECFTIGEELCFSDFRKGNDDSVSDFALRCGDEYPSIPLNCTDGCAEDGLMVRGRLRCSADSMDFFTADGQTGMDASKRIKGVVLHDILSRIIVPMDVDRAVKDALDLGELTSDEAEKVRELLKIRIRDVERYGWFPLDDNQVINEAEIIDSDGKVYRPDRVVVADDKVMVVDYKFGEHHLKYERQVRKYADMWRRMGYAKVHAYLWYVQSGEVREL